MSINSKHPPELDIQQWLNTSEPLSLAKLKGKVVVAFAFQMLCPGCVEHSIPQAKRVQALFGSKGVAVIGLHTVFEHHDAMQAESLKAFLHEYRVDFPVGIDMPSEEANDPIPSTMRKYQMQGTPTLLLFDRTGMLRKQKFGREQDLVLGTEIMSLLKEQNETTHFDTTTSEKSTSTVENCDQNGCAI